MSGVPHGQMDRFHRFFDLRRPADLFRQKIARMGDADAEPLAA